jgi:cysteine desulfurase
MSMALLFLDANAHVALNPAGLKAFNDFSNSTFASHGNAMAANYLGREAAKELEKARTKIAELIGAKSHNQIIFTSTCTQACEWGLDILKTRNYKNVFVSQLEHPAIRYHFRDLFGQSELHVTKDGVAICEQPYPDSTAVVCLHVQNEIGTIQPIENIKADVVSDMSQSLAKLPINMSKLSNVKLAMFAAHKFGGPSSLGFMYIQDTDWWKEFGSGSRYYFDRAGSPDVVSAIMTAASLEHAMKTMPERYDRMVRFRNTLEPELENLGFKIIGKNTTRLPNTTFIQLKKRMGPYVMSQLESENIYVGLGSACGSMNTGSSPVMNALGYGGTAHDFLRISQFGEYAEKEAKTVAAAIAKYCPKSDIP